MEFSRETLIQGVRNQEASAETPDSFATSDGAAIPRNTSPLDICRAPAGALQISVARFGMSNQGMEFNQAKMMMSQPQQTPENK